MAGAPPPPYESYSDDRGAPDDDLDNGVVISGAPRVTIRRPFCAKSPMCGSRGPRVWCVRRLADRVGVALVSIAAVLMVLGAVSPALVRSLVRRGIDQQTIVTPDTKSAAYKTFVDSGYDMGVYLNYSIYWFNVTNPTQVLKGKTPILEEVGPFVYREHRRKLDLEFSDDGELVSYRMLKYYVFDAESTPGGLSDTLAVTTINPVTQFVMGELQRTLTQSVNKIIERNPVLGGGWWPGLNDAALRAAKRAELWEVVLKLVLCEGGDMGPSPFTTMPVKDLYFGHHNDSVLAAMQGLTRTLKKISDRLHLHLPIPPVPEAFPGIAPNLTDEADMRRRVGPNVVHTGRNDRANLQAYTAFQNMTYVHACPDPTTGPAPGPGEMPACYVFQANWTEKEARAHGYVLQWNSSEASMVAGSDGSMFTHPLHDAQEVVTFQEDYRRPVVLGFAREHSDFRGVKLRRYIFRDDDWRNDSLTSAAYFQANLPTGLANVSATGGFPLYLSKPHFLEADPSVQSRVLGLAPDVDKHLTYIDVEPTSGVTFDTHKRIQINAFLTDLDFNVMDRELSDVILMVLGRKTTGSVASCFRSKVTWRVNGDLFLPLMWYDEGFAMPHSFTSSFKTQVLGSQAAAKKFNTAAWVVGPLMLLVAVALFVVPRVRQRRQQFPSLPPLDEFKSGEV